MHVLKKKQCVKLHNYSNAAKIKKWRILMLFAISIANIPIYDMSIIGEMK